MIPTKEKSRSNYYFAWLHVGILNNKKINLTAFLKMSPLKIPRFLVKWYLCCSHLRNLSICHVGIIDVRE
jgi:hypothetical protein